MQPKLSFFTLLLLISFASVNGVLFTPALPHITLFFGIDDGHAQYTITWFLIGYALGQLVYSPMANRFGRKPALYAGILLQIVSSLLCVFAGSIYHFGILIFARFLLALGAGVGLKMTFTLVNESYEPKIASQKIAYLMLAFAITPGLGIALGGFLNSHFGWQSCFYAGAVYGAILLLLVSKLPETLKHPDIDALKLNHLFHNYAVMFKKTILISGGILMGGSTSFVYLFAAVAPFVAIQFFGMTSQEYGFANILPSIGLITGSLYAAHLTKKYSLHFIIFTGIVTGSLGVVLMIILTNMHLPPVVSLFFPMIIIYFGLSGVLANASSLAMVHVSDKAHASAVMNFINMGFTTVMVLSLSLFSMSVYLLPAIYLGLCIFMLTLYMWFKWLDEKKQISVANQS